MSLSLSGTPFGGGKIHPAYNNISFFVDSTNKTLPNFRYVGQFISGATTLFEKKVAPRPGDGLGLFSINRLLSDYVTHENISSTALTDANLSYVQYDFQCKEEYTQQYTWTAYTEATGATSPFNINVQLEFTTSVPFAPNDQILVQQSDGGLEQPLLEGILTVIEVLDGTNVVVNRKYLTIGQNEPASGSTITGTVTIGDGEKFVSTATTLATSYKAVNAALRHDEILDYSGSNYLSPGLGTLTNDGQWWSSCPYTGMTLNFTQPMLLNFATDSEATSVLNYIYLEDDLGNVARREIDVSSNFMTAFNVGPQNVKVNEYNTISGDTFPIKTGATFYTVYLGNAAGDKKSQTYKFNLNYDCYKYNTRNVVFMDRLGSLGSFAFYYKDEETQNITRDSGTKILGNLIDGEWGFDPQDRGKEVYYTSRNKTLSLTTAWLSDEESEYFQDLIASPQVWLQDLNNLNRYYPVIIETNSSVKKRKINNKNIRYTINVSFANKDAINW